MLQSYLNVPTRARILWCGVAKEHKGPSGVRTKNEAGIFTTQPLQLLFLLLLQMASSSILWARKWLCLETTVKPRCKLTWERVARIAFIPLFQDFGGDQSRDYVRLGPWGSCVRRSSRQTGVFGLSEDGAHLCGPGIAASFLPRDIKEEKEIK